MTPNEKYTEGQWYGWNGGECPVHPETVVDVIRETSKGHVVSYYKRCACEWCWSSDDEQPIGAFRVIKHHIEKKVIWVNEYYDICWSAYETKEEAIKYAGKTATRIAVRYEETPE